MYRSRPLLCSYLHLYKNCQFSFLILIYIISSLRVFNSKISKSSYFLQLFCRTLNDNFFFHYINIENLAKLNPKNLEKLIEFTLPKKSQFLGLKNDKILPGKKCETIHSFHERTSSFMHCYLFFSSRS